MGFIKDLLGKKNSSCCDVKIEEVKDEKSADCSTEEKDGKNDDSSCCK